MISADRLSYTVLFPDLGWTSYQFGEQDADVFAIPVTLITELVPAIGAR
jgi:hypothetical protein